VPVGVDATAAHAPRGGQPQRDKHRYLVLAIDRRTGKTIWERVARENTPHEPSHQDNGTWASSSAITDGKRVFAWFESQGMYVYDMDGKLLWEKDLGDKLMRNQFGEGSTPVLHDNRLVIVWDQQGGQSFIVSLDADTGRELWRVNRDEIDTWATPLVVEHGGRAQVIVPGMNKVRSYDLKDGAIVWEQPGTTMNPIPSPVFEDGLVFVMSGFRGNNLKASGIADGSIVWSLDRDTPERHRRPLRRVLYFLDHPGICPLTRIRKRTISCSGSTVPNVFGLAGRRSGPGLPARAEGVTMASGTTEYEVLAKNKLDTLRRPARLVDNDLAARYQFLYNIAEK
jgi:outer membrane protein assembly factor BamB